MTPLSKVFSVGILALAVVLGSCTQPAVKPTDDVRRIQQIDRFIEDLRSWFVAKDLSALASHYPPDRQAEVLALAPILNAAERLELDFLVDRIRFDQEAATVNLHWELRWGPPPMNKAGSAPMTRRGEAIFHLEGKEDLRLTGIEGDDPFLAPSGEKLSFR